MIKHVIFDFDGTIVNSRALAIELYNGLAGEKGFKTIEEGEVEHLSKLTIKERLNVLHIPFHKVPGLLWEMKSSYQKLIGSLKVKEGIPDLLKILKDYELGLSIISSNSEKIIKAFLDHNTITAFEHIFSSRSLFGKNVVINRFLRKFEIQKEQVLYIGDELRDISACEKSNIRIVTVTWGFDSEELLLKGKPDFIIHEPADLLVLLQDLNSA